MSDANVCEGCGEPSEYSEEDGRLTQALRRYDNGNGTTLLYHPECWLEMMDDDVSEDPDEQRQ